MPLRSRQKKERIGGPGASHENRRHPEKSQPRGREPEATKNRRHSGMSGGSGEPDSHNSRSRPARPASDEDPRSAGRYDTAMKVDGLS
jgi:hypothetical protein